MFGVQFKFSEKNWSQTQSKFSDLSLPLSFTVPVSPFVAVRCPCANAASRPAMCRAPDQNHPGAPGFGRNQPLPVAAPARHAPQLATPTHAVAVPGRCAVASSPLKLFSSAHDANSYFPSSPPHAIARARAPLRPEMSSAPWPPSSELAVVLPLRQSADQIN